MALAVDLGLRGISCAVIERHRTPQRIPKGQSLTQRTLEHFYFWGIADQLRAARLLPPGYPIGSITGVISGARAQIIVQAVNVNLQGVASDPIVFTMPPAASANLTTITSPQARFRRHAWTQRSNT